MHKTLHDETSMASVAFGPEKITSPTPGCITLKSMEEGKWSKLFKLCDSKGKQEEARVQWVHQN